MHGLVEHLQNVAELAAKFAGKFGAADFGYWAGLWHDLGKFHPDFQAYLANPTPAKGPDHKGAGSIVAAKVYEPLAFLVAGHHGGLYAKTGPRGLNDWLKEKARAPQVQEAIRLAQNVISRIEPVQPLTHPTYVQTELDAEFFIRMVFSALTDADFLDTEQHFDTKKSKRRQFSKSLADLWKLLEANQQGLTGKKQDRVNIIRDEVYRACLKAADQPPGFFRLTVPTGGGKTLSSMAFALRHSLAHGLERVIVAIPYTSIIEQTADVYRQVFANCVVEHHSAVNVEEDEHNPSEGEVWSRLASENWDAPIIVTTTVQLFESLFGNKTSQCRKLHNIARSVIILDEVQTLPSRLLEPILDGLKRLVDHYGVTAVLCTATQPALEQTPYLKGLKNVREIVPNSERLYSELKRVQYEFSQDGQTLSWKQIADTMREARQVLAVVNTKADVISLLAALDDPEALHLSTLMCGAHRRDTLREVKHRLFSGEACRLVSTQVVEAGVDLDFPFVMRALGPLDRIVQAAGRCNREGLLKSGKVVVFIPAEGGKLPPGDYQSATSTTRSLLASPDFDFHDPEVYRTYFRRLYQVVDLDAEKIQDRRRAFDYPEVASRFKLIEDNTVPVVVRYRGPQGTDDTVDRLLSYVRHQHGEAPRWLQRRLQPYLVNVRQHLIGAYQRDGLLVELMPGLWEWFGRYDAVRGIIADNRDPSDLVV